MGCKGTRAAAGGGHPLRAGATPALLRSNPQHATLNGGDPPHATPATAILRNGPGTRRSSARCNSLLYGKGTYGTGDLIHDALTSPSPFSKQLKYVLMSSTAHHLQAVRHKRRYLRRYTNLYGLLCTCFWVTNKLSEKMSHLMNFGFSDPAAM
ncbi:hypothetical protein E2562_038245, partial [Oryza meyeriana var. granulata]